MIRIVGAVLTALLVALPAFADQPLRPPAYMLRPSDPRAAPPPACGVPPAPVRALDLQSAYRADTEQQRAQSDTLDPAALARYRQQVAGLHGYQFELTKRVDQYIRSGSPVAAGCALDWLQAWATEDAMLAPMSLQGRFEEKWHAAGMCLGFLKISAATGLASDKLATVRAHLVRLGRAARDGNHGDGKPPGADDDVIAHNNHAYWAGLAAAACATAGADRPLFDWGIAQYRRATADVTPAGFLPLELKRGTRALGYHVMSLDALVMLAELGEANGLKLYDDAGGALHRLVATVARGLLDPALFARASGSPQEPNAAFADYYLSWTELYAARKPLPALQQILAAHRPVGHRFLGGDVPVMLAVAAHAH
jgi:Alginate lyase